MTERDKITVDDIIGLVDCEPTNSVEEVRKLRGRENKTEKRFIKGYCCGDVGLVDTKKEEWFVENINSISDSERNWNDVLDKLNEVADENEQLKEQLADANELKKIYVDFMVDNGFELSDVIEYSRGKQ